MSLIPIRVYSRDSRANISTHLCRSGAALRISAGYLQCPLDRVVSRVSHAESPSVDGPAVGPELLSEFVRSVRPFESPDRIVWFGQPGYSRLSCCSQNPPHSCCLRCYYSDCRPFV